MIFVYVLIDLDMCLGCRISQQIAVATSSPN